MYDLRSSSALRNNIRQMPPTHFPFKLTKLSAYLSLTVCFPPPQIAKGIPVDVHSLCYSCSFLLVFLVLTDLFVILLPTAGPPTREKEVFLLPWKPVLFMDSPLENILFYMAMFFVRARWVPSTTDAHLTPPPFQYTEVIGSPPKSRLPPEVFIFFFFFPGRETLSLRASSRSFFSSILVSSAT